MAHVFLARDETLRRAVVVKVLPIELGAGLSAERFAREIRLAARLQEPHIVPVLSAGTTSEGLPYYTMSFVRGESLRKRLAAGPLPIAEATSILRDVARALAYAHEQGVVHRDIKPENVLLASDTAVVTDFGIAKAVGEARTHERAEGMSGTLTEAGTSLGTPAYMAPEWATGFILAGLVGVVLLLASGIYLGIKGKALKLVLEQLTSRGADQPAPKLVPPRLVMVLPTVNTGIAIAVVYDMVMKPTSVPVALSVVGAGIVLGVLAAPKGPPAALAHSLTAQQS